MNRKIKTWAYAILLLNIVVAGIGIAKLLFDVFTGNGNTQVGNNQYGCRLSVRMDDNC